MKIERDEIRSGSLERLLDLLEVRLAAFAVCEIEDTCALKCDALDAVVVHFVLSGHGSIECSHGSFPLRPGSLAIIPRHLAKTVIGRGPVLRTVNATESCPLVDGLVKFGASESEADLSLGCASITATVGGGFDLFSILEHPLVEGASDDGMKPLFDHILRELSAPRQGTRAIVSTLMKHILLVLLRDHFERAGSTSPLFLPLSSPQLGQALLAILARPQDPHCVDSLASTAQMGRSSFARHFTSAYGRTPMEMVHSVRLRAARRMLQGSQLPIKSIAAAVGFSSRSYFSRAFRSEYGMDPTAYRSAADLIRFETVGPLSSD